MSFTPEIQKARHNVKCMADDLSNAIEGEVEDLTPYWLLLEEAFWEMAEKIEDADPNVEEARKEIQEELDFKK